MLQALVSCEILAVSCTCCLRVCPKCNICCSYLRQASRSAELPSLMRGADHVTMQCRAAFTFTSRVARVTTNIQTDTRIDTTPSRAASKTWPSSRRRQRRPSLRPPRSAEAAEGTRLTRRLTHPSRESTAERTSKTRQETSKTG